MKMKKRLLSLLLAATMALPAIPLTANAAETQNGQPDVTVNQSKVAFAGHEWWVIGDGTNGVYPQSGHITLLAANLDSDFQNVPFRSGQDNAGDGYTKYTDEYNREKYYANNPGGMEAWTTPNEYAGSTLQQKMEELTNGIPVKEQAVISTRSLTGGGTYQNPSTDKIAGPEVTDQKLWALSDSEWYTIYDKEVCKYGDDWWMRSPYSNYSAGSWFGDKNGDPPHQSDPVDNNNNAVRPAFSLNLSSVLFTSAADASGKSSATAGGGLIDISSPAGTVKFTMKDSEQTLTVNATTAQSTQTGEALSFGYSGATTGENQYVSCILTDDSRAVKYYGKLADSSSAASGNLSVPLAGVADGTYTLKIFSEQVNDNLYTDFCSEPVSMKVAVTGGSGTVSEFGGTLLHEHSWSDEWSSNNTHHWHECTVSGCPVTDNSQKDGYAEHTYNQAVATDQYLKSAADCNSPAVYYQSCVCGAFSETADTFTQGTATGHSWGEPVWNWAEDGKSATVTFTCNNDSTHTQSPEATITSKVKTPATCTEKGITTYTATVTLDGKQYTSTKDVADIAKLSHTLKKTDRVEATCTTDGKEAYYTCESCGKHFSDAEGKNEITNLEEYGIIPATEHKAGTEWKHNETVHWNECMNNCGEKLNESAHTFEWVVDKEATATEAGSKHEECTVCGYEKTAVEIPATGTTDPTDPPKPTDPDKENPGEETDIPQTGDNSDPLMWIMLTSLSGGAILALTLKGRKKTKQ